MLNGCRFSQRFGLGMALVLAAVTGVRARAELADAAGQFIEDYDALAAKRGELEADRAAMAQALGGGDGLVNSVSDFFSDRAQVFVLRYDKYLDRRDMRKALAAEFEPLPEPAEGTGVLAEDVRAYLAAYDQWQACRAAVQGDLESIRAALASGDATSLTEAVTQFFTDARSRHAARIQTQVLIRAMKRDAGFTRTGEPEAPAPGPLREDMAEYLADFAAWEDLRDQLDADRNNLRAAVESPDSLELAVLTFLNDRRALWIKSEELRLDQEAMARDLRIRTDRLAKRFLRNGKELSKKDLDQDEEEEALGESSDTAGEN